MPKYTIHDIFAEVQPALEEVLPMLTGGEVIEEEGEPILCYPHPDAPDVYTLGILFDNDGINEGFNTVSVLLINNGGLVCTITQGLVSGSTAIEQIVFALSVSIPQLNDHILMLQQSEDYRTSMNN